LKKEKLRRGLNFSLTLCFFFLFGFNLRSEIVVISKNHFNVLADKMKKREKKEYKGVPVSFRSQETISQTTNKPHPRGSPVIHGSISGQRPQTIVGRLSQFYLFFLTNELFSF
jgi:DNA polymerase sigma